MDAVLRAISIYVFLLLLFRLAGRRTLAQSTVFDLALVLIISEATQNALIGNDYSMTNSFLIIMTLVGVDIVLSLIKRQIPMVNNWIEGRPLVVVRHGRPSLDLMRKARIDMEDILAASRNNGIERMDEIKYAVLETNGEISVIRKSNANS